MGLAAAELDVASQADGLFGQHLVKLATEDAAVVVHAYHKISFKMGEAGVY